MSKYQDMIEKINNIESKNDSTIKDIEINLKQLKNLAKVTYRKPLAVVAGKMGSGKSTLINSLLAGEYLPVGQNGKTKFPIFIKHINDRPEKLNEEVYILDCKDSHALGVNFDLLNDDKYIADVSIASGEISLLNTYFKNENEEIKSLVAIVYLNAVFLDYCDLVDIPGFNNISDINPSILNILKDIDVLVYCSFCKEFIDANDTDFLNEFMCNTVCYERKDINPIKPLSNIFIVATKVQSVNISNEVDIKCMLDGGCIRLAKELPSNYWQNRCTISGYQDVEDLLKECFFIHTKNVPSVNVKLYDRMSSSIDYISKEIEVQSDNELRAYIDSTISYLKCKRYIYDRVVKNKDKYTEILKNIEDDELSFWKNRNEAKKQVRDFISEISHNAADEFSNYMGEHINKDSLVTLLKKNSTMKTNSILTYLREDEHQEIARLLEKGMSKINDFIHNYVITCYANEIQKMDIESNVFSTKDVLNYSVLLDIDESKRDGLSKNNVNAVWTKNVAAYAWSGGAAGIAGLVAGAMGGMFGIAFIGVFCGGQLLINKAVDRNTLVNNIIAFYDENDVVRKYVKYIKDYWTHINEKLIEMTNRFDSQIEELNACISDAVCLSDEDVEAKCEAIDAVVNILEDTELYKEK